MFRIFEKCPACSGRIVITECKCVECKLQMRGEFWNGRFSSLSEDQLTFIQVFLRARGNLSEVEKVLGVSYPTIRNKLDEINDNLDSEAATLAASQGKRTEPTMTVSPSIEEARRDVLQHVAAGEISAADALNKLQNLQGEK